MRTPSSPTWRERALNRLLCLGLALALGLGAGLGLGLTAPAAAVASQLDTDILCGTQASKTSYGTSVLPDIEAANAIVVGADGTVYYERDATEQVKIASITKVMTAIVALENASLDDTIYVDYAAATVGESSAYLQYGDTMTLKVALKALLMPSGNDAAMAIASSVGALIDPESDDPYQVFIDAMNEKAAELGMEDSVFTNPHGLDFDDWEDELCSTANDVAIMFAYAMQNDDFREAIADTDTEITVTSASGEERTWTLNDYNQILGEYGNIGGKTGTTYEALSCFVGAFSRDEGGEVYVVVLGCADDETRWADTVTLAEWYYDHVAEVPLCNTIAYMGDVPVIAEIALTSWTDKVVRATLEDTSETVTAFSLAGAITQEVTLYELSGAVAEGDVVGTITYSQNGEVLGSADLIAAETVDEPGPFEWLMIQFDRLVRTIRGEATVAESVVYNEVPNPGDYDAV